MGKLCLIIPCYNEKNRLDLEKIERFSKSVFIIFVNDGSTDGTSSLIERHIGNNMFLLNLENNSGKAEAVRQGALFLKTLPFYNEIEWFGYWDADLAAPLDEALSFITYIEKFYPDAKAVFGSRIKRAGSKINRSLCRQIISRIFVFLFRLLFKLNTCDSQCGAKLFRKEIVDTAFREPFLSKWIFDVEIILRLKNLKVIEYPLREWSEVSGSKIVIFKNLKIIFSDVYYLWKKYG